MLSQANVCIVNSVLALFQANVCIVNSVLARQALSVCILCFFTATSLPIEFHSHPHHWIPFTPSLSRWWSASNPASAHTVVAVSSFGWCLMSSDVGWRIWDQVRPIREHGSILLYVHGNHEARKDGQPRTATSTLTQLLNYDCCCCQCSRTSAVNPQSHLHLLRSRVRRSGRLVVDVLFPSLAPFVTNHYTHMTYVPHSEHRFPAPS